MRGREVRGYTEERNLIRFHIEFRDKSGNDSLMMVAEKASETSDYESVLTQLVGREDFIDKYFLCYSWKDKRVGRKRAANL